MKIARNILLISLLILTFPTLLLATTFLRTAGGTDFFAGDIDGGNVFVGNIRLEQMVDFDQVALKRTNEGSGLNISLFNPGESLAHQVLVEMWPQNYQNNIQLTYTTDNWLTSSTDYMLFDGYAGNNDRYRFTIPDAVHNNGTRVEFYIMAHGPTKFGNAFDVYVPGDNVNFYYDVQVIPEPSTVMLFGISLIGISVTGYFKKRKSKK